MVATATQAATISGQLMVRALPTRRFTPTPSMEYVHYAHMSYTVRNLKQVEDSAVKFGFSETQEAHFARKDLDAEATGLAYYVVKPGKRQPFAHRHNEAEEIYVVLSGTGRMKLDDEIVDVEAFDAIRVAPQVARAFEAGDDGLEVLAVGTHHGDDRGDMLQDFWNA
jgi:mannose-6-phosphate isomerase-like protein (cupin superfamily)